jgi:hypothetical protein
MVRSGREKRNRRRRRLAERKDMEKLLWEHAGDGFVPARIIDNMV